MATILNDSTLYLCDGGACYCGKHCGVTARLTGCDASGEAVRALSAADVIVDGFPPSAFACESCGRSLERPLDNKS